MLQRIKHRGPDGTSVYANEAAGVALGQTHLNAFVADSRAAAPGFGKTGNLAVAIDGCVTNRADILERQTVAPVPAPINQDVEAVMTAYHAYGENCLSKLDGPFSLALWDQQKRKRDRLSPPGSHAHA
jgi:asparagine synthase (glutamine-hydrolysing)